ncbi:2-dehydro-3-deoxygalactonokinase [Caulobacter sp. KR2-114]|uniref:2-dehydro-3-deoxygalactonokinase n=1 Tax=Caulobacter sp. KR2-114 TaxID=3400912 RepID=UPI003C0A1E1A
MPAPSATYAGVLLADWGSSTLRAWRLDGAGAVAAQASFPLGVSRLAPGGAAEALDSVVRSALGAAGLPALLCGAIGSNVGWIDAGYVDCPASPATVAGRLARPAADVAIVPGLRCYGPGGPDVLRGEETQALGWLQGDPARRRGARLLCLPGTHAKWLAVADGQVVQFASAMTGELYALLGEHSILRTVEPEAAPYDPAAFLLGIDTAGDGSAFATRLFAARGRLLAGQFAAEAAPSYLSGLLIGAEVNSLWPAMRAEAGRVELIGDAKLTGLYATAMQRLRIPHKVWDGDAAVLCGLKTLWKMARAG